MSFSPKDLLKAGWGAPVNITYNKRESILYSLGIGSQNLKFVYENHDEFSPFPTMPFALTFKGDSLDVLPFPPPAFQSATPAVPPAGPVLDGERYIEYLKPLPEEALPDEFAIKSKPTAILDKGKGALVESETILFNLKTNDVYCRILSGAFFVGVTGFESAGTSHAIKVPTDFLVNDNLIKTVTETVSTQQAMLYRLSGDYNPLHIDPDTATVFGFKKPILHGLCTMGIATRHVMDTLSVNEIKSVHVRFAKPVLPGDTLKTCIYKNPKDNTVFYFNVYVGDKLVADNGVLTLNSAVKKSSNL